MRTRIGSLIFLCLATSAFAADFSANRSLGFESGNFSGWQTSRLSYNYSGQIVSVGSRPGNYCARFELRERDFNHNGFRAEISDGFYAPENSKMIYSFSVFIPKYITLTPDNRCIISQWHDQDMDHGLPSVVHSPPLSISLNMNQLEIKQCLSDDNGNCRKQSLYKGVVPFGEWLDFRFAIHWSTNMNGQIHAWLNGAKIINYSGPVANKAYANPNDNVGAYMKFGVYCAKGPKEPLFVFHDGYRREITY